uniref:Uncharacterized protein n=1 Tax=uncultured bacterium contig00055 TaxID=1181539 RepID=A0A806KR92_9BACT|nr:hypothetical protein [uncultured bacterium contig00055]
MAITQTVEIPADRRLIIEVPPQVPTGPVILTFTPVDRTPVDDAEECPICARYRDPVTGEERFNAETAAAIREGRAMMRGEIPSKWFSSAEELFADLERDDDD